MGNQCKHISKSIVVLKDNFVEIAQVSEWADLMGYSNSKEFSRKFLRYYAVRPCKMLEYVRLISIHQQLKADKFSNFQIARQHSLPDEIALNKFVNYHLGCCPSKLAVLNKDQLHQKLEKFGSNFRE